MLERTKLSLAVSAAIGAGLAGLAPGAGAQAPAAPQSLERVEVTGSLIKRIEGELGTPVVTISIEELQRAGVTNAEQAVKFITQNQSSNGAATTGSVSGTNGAASYADLRNLGPQRTLVLLNGRRIAPNPFSVVAVDLNTLPLAAVQRIETLPDGASAIYGTDAIAGVINFITRREYTGLTVGAEAQIPQEDGGEIYTANLLGGWGNLAKEGWNVYGSLNYRAGKPMSGIERDFARTSFIAERGYDGTSGTTFPGNYSQAVGGVPTVSNTNPTLPNCAPPLSITGGRTTSCRADTQLFTYTIPEQDQWSALLRGSLALGANNTAFLEYFHAYNKVATQIAPSPETGLTMFPTSPFYPGNGITPITNPALDTTQPISIGWRTTAVGPRTGEQENNTQRVVAGLEGAGMGWDYQASLLWSKAEVENVFTGGYPTTQPLRDGVAGLNGAPFLNPFGPQTPAGLAYLQANQVLGQVQDGTAELRSATGVISRQFGQLPGGPMSVALAAEYREEEMVYNTDVPKVSQASSSGLAGGAAVREGDRDVSAVAVEFAFPVLKNLELGAAVRYDNYSDFGNTTNPKFTLRFTPVQQLLLRASFNTGFVAPTLEQLYSPLETTFTGNVYDDPVLCPGGVPAPGAVESRDCNLQFQQQQGGNTALQPEESIAWTIGFVFQPVPSFSFGVDYWNYRIKSNIGVIGEETIFGSSAQYANLFVRCSQAGPALQNSIGACQNPGGVDPLAFIINTNQNLGETETTGFDFQANWQGPATTYGRFNIGLRSSYVKSFDFQIVEGGPYFNPVGNYSAEFEGPVIRYQQVITLGWQWDVWSANLFNRYQSGYLDQNNVAPQFTNRVQDYSVTDISATYKGFKGLTLQAGILNLFDKDPPFSNQTARFNARAYDDRFYNPLGRVFTIAASYQFF